MFLDGKNMKTLFALLTAVTLSGCYVTIEQVSTYPTNCSSVYGHADLYRTQNTTVRVKEYARHC